MEKLLTIQQLSDLLQIKSSTVYKWVHYGYIPHVKLGSCVRFKEDRILSWLAKRERKGRSSYGVHMSV